MSGSSHWIIVAALMGMAAVSFAGPSNRFMPLINGDLESDTLHEGWTIHVYGAQPKVTADREVRREGRQSLRISADAPSDTALGQELRLVPGRWYRLSGWVRTENLDPQGSPTCGTFQIQSPGGGSIIASGRNHAGTNDWTRESIVFTPPGDGLTRLALFFVGFGKGTGTAWFDQITLEEIDSPASAWTITAEQLNSGMISPMQHGQFIEYLCALTLSMHAEKIHDGSFEGVPEYRFVFRKETDRLERPWYPDGAVHRGDYAIDSTTSYNGKQSQRITQKDGNSCTLGLSQNDKSIKTGELLRCSLYLRSASLQNPVRILLWGHGKTYAAAEFKPTSQWQRYEATLTPSDTDEHATFTIEFRGPGTLWIDQVSLMPANTIHGWRIDVAEALKALKPGIIRFGGSTLEFGFEWTNTIGDPAKRVPFTTYWGGLEPGNAGLEEFVGLCQWVGAEPLICIRFTGKKPKDAADQVEYFNGPPTSPMGKLRAANGHVQPYGVKYWQIGNELGDEEYQKGLAEFCRAMKAVDPTIKLMAAFPTPGLLKNAGQHIDYICPHHYGCQNLPAMEADIAQCRQMIAQHAPGRNIRLAITEWNTTAGDWGLSRAMLWTLGNALACSRYQNLMHRHCDLIEIANRSNLVDSFCSGIIQTNNSGLYKTPTYYAQQLYATHSSAHPLKVRIDGDLAHDPAIDVSATLSVDGRTLSIFAVNSGNQPQKRIIDLQSLRPTSDRVAVWTLLDTAKAGESDAANSWREPDRIRIEPGEAAMAGGKLAYEFPALSLTVLKISVQGGR